MKQTTILLTAFLGLSACDVAGDFCQVVKAPLVFDPSTSAVMVKTDRIAVEGIAVQNEYGGKHCDWAK